MRNETRFRVRSPFVQGPILMQMAIGAPGCGSAS